MDAAGPDPLRAAAAVAASPQGPEAEALTGGLILVWAIITSVLPVVVVVLVPEGRTP